MKKEVIKRIIDFAILILNALAALVCTSSCVQHLT